ncbi:methylation-associated defense system protein MAD7 [Actinomadura xylanilytica]|uniref:methylation-associated defense system protein MAD7 n=1 Tax=Actinomadura xylanilytica TaxID=887459 RepID=UPI00255AD0A2|nr:hypothetical protein [Actinomadura xylanilytica]MDL4777723.1 hypothetical protein [Actinomadura xylanilytica]
MTIVIPKQLRSLEFTELTLVELNDVDVDRLLPHLWELVIKQGRMSSAPKDADDYGRYLAALAASGRLDGFDDEQGMKVLDGWLRSSIVRIGAKGRARSGTQMDYIQPLTIASYRAGLPKTRRHRHAHTLIYHLLIEQLRQRGVEAPEQNLGNKLRKAVGAGVNIGPTGQWVPEYDGRTDIDINALLSLYFLEEFTPLGARTAPQGFRSSVVPGATRGLADDLLDYLIAYGGRLTPSAFVDRFAALISLRLFQLPLRVARAARHVLNTGEKSEDMRDDVDAPNPLELYCDFTRVRGAASDELARQCVLRDLEIMSGFMPNRLLLRSLREAMPALRKRGEEIKNLPMPDGLVAMIGLREDPLISAYAIIKMQAIEEETREHGTDEDLEFIASVMDSDEPSIEQLTTLLVEGLSGTALKNQVRWFSSTGGIMKPHGLITGSMNSRRSWRYAPSDDLMYALLLVCFTAAQGSRLRSRMPIAQLLKTLHDRFGILIDRPPAAFDSVDNRAAAAANLEAFKRRLRLLGCFDGLSDDFSAQYVRNPLETA